MIAGILPWNFPFFLIVRKMAPALVTGNTIVIKPSSETPNNAFEFARLVAQSSLPKGVFNLVSGAGSVVGKALAGHPRVGMVSLTGSVEGGVAVMHAAAENVTKVSLELGGKAPAIVMGDADIDLAVRAIRASRIINTGQVCNCAERVYVQQSVAAEFIAKMTAAMQQTVSGDPFAADTEMGPMVSKRQRELVHAAVQQAIKDGAKLECGGNYASGTGYYYEPTVLTGCRQETAIMQQEIFGPVLPIATFETLDEAIALRQRLRVRADLVHLHAQPGCGHAGLERAEVRRDLCEPRELRGHAGLPRRMAQVRHRRRGRQARPGGVLADPRRLHEL